MYKRRRSNLLLRAGPTPTSSLRGTTQESSTSTRRRPPAPPSIYHYPKSLMINRKTLTTSLRLTPVCIYEHVRRERKPTSKPSARVRPQLLRLARIYSTIYSSPSRTIYEGKRFTRDDMSCIENTRRHRANVDAIRQQENINTNFSKFFFIWTRACADRSRDNVKSCNVWQSNADRRRDLTSQPWLQIVG